MLWIRFPIRQLRTATRTFPEKISSGAGNSKKRSITLLRISENDRITGRQFLKMIDQTAEDSGK